MDTSKSWEWYEGELPWVPLRPLHLQLEEQPTILTAEALFFFCAAVALAHAVSHGRQHVLVWLCAMVGGTANDIFFMVLPFVDNFFHAQCTVMLTPRLPLYIPCAYIAFVYFSTASSWRSTLTTSLGQSALAGLAGALFYCMFDIVGAKFLWWTWHDTDAGVSERWLGVPVGSTMWTLVHCFTFSLLLHRFALHQLHLSLSSSVVALLAVALLNTPFMMAVMIPSQLHQLRVSLSPSFAVLQQPGRPDLISLFLVIAVLLFLVVQASRTKRPHFLPWFKRNLKWDSVLMIGVSVYCTSLFLTVLVADPSAVVSTGNEEMRCHHLL